MTTASASDALALTASSFLREHLEHAQRACITSSFQSEDVVVLHMVLQLQPQIPVIFLETGYHFPETLAYRDRIAAEWNLNLDQRRSRAIRSRAGGAIRHSQPDRTRPLLRAAQSRAALPRSRLLHHLGHRLAPPAVQVARQSPAARVLHACPPARSSPSSALLPSGRRATSGNTPSSTLFRSSRSTKRVTPPSVALPVPACPSMPTTHAPAAGPAANSSAAFTCRPLMLLN